MNGVAFLTTIFPMNKQYLLDFFGSLTRQTYDKFDVVVVNDGYSDLDEITTLFKGLTIVELPFSSRTVQLKIESMALIMP